MRQSMSRIVEMFRPAIRKRNAGGKNMQSKQLRALIEGAIMVSMAQILSYLKIYELVFGGSVTLAMIPIFLYCARWGFGKGMLASFVFGILQFVFDGQFAYTWQAIILDYILAFSLLGTAGIFSKQKYGIFYGTVAGSVMRFAAHLLSGVYVWGEYMPDEFLGITMNSLWIYSALYNSIYVGANMIICFAVFAVMFKPMNRYIRGEDLQK